MRFTSLEQFRRSKEWEACKQQVDFERQDKDGFIRCEMCGVITKSFNPDKTADNRNALIHHHTIEMTIANMNDYDISLNPKRIQCLCVRCHNKVHERFGFSSPRKVYIVTGAPCSGKTSFVKENMKAGDIVCDIDSLWEAISGQERYVKPKGLYPFIEAVERELREQIKMMSNGTAWIITGAPSAKERQDLAIKLNGEVIHIDTPKQECLDRLYSNPNGRDVNAWTGYIERYFDRLTM